MNRLDYIKTAIVLFTFLASLVTGQPTTMTGSKGLRECASCHYQWIEAFEQPYAKLLVEKPKQPMEAESSICLSCHDGSVVDSRRLVWIEHGHKKDFVPPPEMEIPEVLPLKDGKIVCRTCHSAHLSDEPVNLDNPIFLRVKNDESQLCHLCHTDKIPGQGHSDMHLLAEMSEPVPDELLEAGARNRSDQRKVHCMVCHIPHGSKEDHMLVMGADNNGLCLACHTEQRPGMWHEQKGLHPDQPFVTEAHQIEVINKIGTRLSPDNRLICLSCHRMHHGESGRFMLALPLEESKFCIECHPRYQAILETSHDPREFAMDKKNYQDLSIEEAGPCSSCHMFHSLAQLPNPQDFDASDMCLNCHDDISWDLNRETQPLKAVMHPHSVIDPTAETPDGLNPPQTERMDCQSCHDIHTHIDSPHLLRIESDAKPVELCYSCHPDIRSLEYSMHNAKATEQIVAGNPSPCGPCHVAHATQDSSSQKLWALPLAKNSKKPPSEQRCMACHHKEGLAGLPEMFEHPEPELITGAMQLYADMYPEEMHISHVHQITCLTCHLPHGQVGDHVVASQDADEMALNQKRANRRMIHPSTAQRLCAQCHGIEAANLYLYYHNPEKRK